MHDSSFGSLEAPSCAILYKTCYIPFRISQTSYIYNLIISVPRFSLHSFDVVIAYWAGYIIVFPKERVLREGGIGLGRRGLRSHDLLRGQMESSVSKSLLPPLHIQAVPGQVVALLVVVAVAVWLWLCSVAVEVVVVGMLNNGKDWSERILRLLMSRDDMHQRDDSHNCF